MFTNHYEKAIGHWLIDNKVRYVEVDEKKRAAFGRAKVKSFDYLVYPPNQPPIVAEIKGKKFEGASLAGLKGLECWVTLDDIEGLGNWQKVFGHGYCAAFIFVYWLEGVDVDCDGRSVYFYDGRNYVFFAVRLEDYIAEMKIRSPKWQTVTLSADGFRKYAVQLQSLFV